MFRRWASPWRSEQPVRRDAAAVVPDGEADPVPLLAHQQLQDGHAPGVDHGVFQKIRQHLADEDRVHGDGEEVLGDGDGHMLLRAALAEFHQDRVDQLLQDRLGLVQPQLAVVQPGDGEQVLHHAHQPLGIVPDAPEELLPVRVGESVEIFQQHGAGAIDGGQGGPQVMGHRPEEVGPHFLPFGVGLELFGVGDLLGQGAGDDGNHQHHHRREKIHRDGKIELKIGKGKGEVDGQDTDEGGGHAPAVAGGQDRDQKHAQHEEHGDQHGGLGDPVGEEAAEKAGRQNSGGEQKIFDLFFHGVIPPIRNQYTIPAIKIRLRIGRAIIPRAEDSTKHFHGILVDKGKGN